MNEVGVDLSAASTSTDDGGARPAQLLTTMGCGDQCRSFPASNATTGHWKIQSEDRSRTCGGLETTFEIRRYPATQHPGGDDEVLRRLEGVRVPCSTHASGCSAERVLVLGPIDQ
jgi:hypothetical protein